MKVLNILLAIISFCSSVAIYFVKYVAIIPFASLEIFCSLMLFWGFAQNTKCKSFEKNIF